MFPAGQGVRCRQCETVHKVSQRRLLASRVAPLLLLLPFLWIEDSPVWLRAVVGAAVLLVFFAPILRPIPGLYSLEEAGPFDDIRDDDGAFESAAPAEVPPGPH